MAELAELVEAELQATLKRYRASPEQVREALLASFAEDRALEVQLHLPLERLRRTRACREAVDRARKRLYAELRRYLPDAEQAGQNWRGEHCATHAEYAAERAGQ